MRTLSVALAASLLGSVALAQDTTVTRTETPLGSSTTVTRESDDVSVTKRTTETTGSLGCETKSVTKTNEFGDSKTKTKTEC